MSDPFHRNLEQRVEDLEKYAMSLESRINVHVHLFRYHRLRRWLLGLLGKERGDGKS